MYGGLDRRRAIPINFAENAVSTLIVETFFTGFRGGVDSNDLLLSAGPYERIEDVRPPGYSPMTLTMTFRLANGQDLTTGKMLCLLLRDGG